MIVYNKKLYTKTTKDIKQQLLLPFEKYKAGLTIRQTRQGASGLQRKRALRRPKRSEMGLTKV
jgi:hypothetical protein